MATTIAAAELIRCAGCAAEKKTKATAKGLLRVPMGWKRHNAQTWCAKCWAERYVLSGGDIWPCADSPRRR